MIRLATTGLGKGIEMFDGVFEEMGQVLDKFKHIDVERFLRHSKMLCSRLGMGPKEVSNCVFYYF